MSTRSVLGRENVPCVAEVVNRSLKADCTDFTTGNPPLEVAPGQGEIHVNSYRCQAMHRGKVDPGVSELPRGNELSRDHVNRP